MNNELIVLFARKFGWTLEYISQLTPKQASSIYAELIHQMEIEEYQDNYRTALIASVMCNLWSKKKYSPEDFIGQPPVKDKQKPTSNELLNIARHTRRERKKDD